MFYFSRSLFCLLIAISLFSCRSGRTLQSVTYLSKVTDSSYGKVLAYEPVIQKGDRLAITVTGLNPLSVAQFNQTPIMADAGTPSTGGGYVVDGNGTINFPQLERIKVEGLTREGFINMLTDSLVKYVMKPVVTVQFLNFRVTVLGEVNHPGTIPLAEGKLNLIEAIGLSGDLTLYGNRENVLVVREKNGTRQLGRVDLTATSIFTSPFYHLQQNDVVYVEMSEEKLKNAENTALRTNVAIIGTATSIVTSIIVLIISLTR